MKVDLLLFGALGLLLFGVVAAEAETVTEVSKCDLTWFDFNHNERIDLREAVWTANAWKTAHLNINCVIKVLDAWKNDIPVGVSPVIYGF
jgi:hypothetical protein